MSCLLFAVLWFAVFWVSVFWFGFCLLFVGCRLLCGGLLFLVCCFVVRWFVVCCL